MTDATVRAGEIGREHGTRDAEAWEAWSQAWDSARDADMAAGRRYDKARYSEAAHLARQRVLRDTDALTEYRETDATHWARNE